MFTLFKIIRSYYNATKISPHSSTLCVLFVFYYDIISGNCVRVVFILVISIGINICISNGTLNHMYSRICEVEIAAVGEIQINSISYSILDIMVNKNVLGRNCLFPEFCKTSLFLESFFCLFQTIFTFPSYNSSCTFFHQSIYFLLQFP
jgi:hypothetical protein